MVCATHDPARELSVWELPSMEHIEGEGDKGFVRKYSNQWAEGWKVLLA